MEKREMEEYGMSFEIDKENMSSEMVLRQAAEIIDAEPWYVAAMSNLSALIMVSMDRLNWAGFYLIRGNELVVGPFQGKPACIRIPVGKGVCGTAIAQNAMQVVPDVHLFPGHIACDSASESEIVIPIHEGEKIRAVLDIDSPVKGRFTDEDKAGLEALIRIIEERVKWGESI
jgi:GAF domain-containing protein